MRRIAWAAAPLLLAALLFNLRLLIAEPDPQLPQPANRTLVGDGVQVDFSINPPVSQPGESVSIDLIVANSGLETASPIVTAVIPQGMLLDWRDLPPSATVNFQTGVLRWQPRVRAQSTVDVSIPLQVVVADVAEPLNQLSATLNDGWRQYDFAAEYWVGVLPSATILSPDSVSVGQPVQLSADIGGSGPTVQQWNLGDGRYFRAENPTTIYAGVGQYEIELQVSNPVGMTTATTLIDVVASPNAHFELSDTTPAVGQPVLFQDRSGGVAPLTYLWDFGGGFELGSAEMLHQFDAPGIYDVRLRVANDAGESETLMSVVVGEPPAADMVLPDSGIEGELIGGTALGDESIIQYAWSMGDGAIYAGDRIKHRYSDSGGYTVSMTASNDYGDTVISRVLQIESRDRFDIFMPFAVVVTNDAQTVADPATQLAQAIPASAIDLDSAQISAELTPAEQLLSYVNAARAQAGLNPLSYSYELSIAAQRHTNDMALAKFTGHTGSDGSRPYERQIDAGFAGYYAGEATAWGFNGAEGAVNFWINSPSHRPIVLNPLATEIGLGFTVDFDAPNVWYWTTEFGSLANANVYPSLPTATPLPPLPVLPTSTFVPPTLAPTNTPLPATATNAPSLATSTPLPATNTPVAPRLATTTPLPLPTAELEPTELPPTATEEATSEPPTATSEPTKALEATATPDASPTPTATTTSELSPTPTGAPATAVPTNAIPTIIPIPTTTPVSP